MKRLTVLLLALLALMLGAQLASAHPLGNFTVNTATRVELSGNGVYLRYALDMAEIPTFRERDAIRRAGGPDGWAAERAPELAKGVVVRVGGGRLVVRPVSQTARLVDGQGGLQTLRLDAWFEVPDALARRGTLPLVVEDRTFDGRLGYRVLTGATTGGASVAGALPDEDPTNGLRSYPTELSVSSAAATPRLAVDWTPGTGPGPVAALTSDPTVTGVEEDGGFAVGLLDGGAGLGAVIVALLAAMAWGAAHALSPGHGKTMVAAYLVGSRGTTRHALLLGLFVTVTHTIGVVALGLVTLWLSQWILPEDLFPWLNLVAALLVVGVGGAVLRNRVRAARARRHAAAHHHHDHAHHHHHDHHHDHDHDHDHDHHHGPGGHTHAPPEDLSMRSLIAVGASAGIVPCPSALVLMLGAISLHQVGWGLVLVVAFSAGLAGLLSVIGVLVIHARRLIDRLPLEGRLSALVPVASAVVILMIGVVLTVRAIPPLV